MARKAPSFRVVQVIVDDRHGFRREPGDTVTVAEMERLGWTQQDITNLVECGALASKED